MKLMIRSESLLGAKEKGEEGEGVYKGHGSGLTHRGSHCDEVRWKF